MAQKVSKKTVEELKQEVEALDKKIGDLDGTSKILIQKYGTVSVYYTQIFGEDGKAGIKKEINDTLEDSKKIQENIDNFRSFINGTDDEEGFETHKEAIIDTYNKAEGLNGIISKNETDIAKFTTQFEDKLEAKLNEIEDIKKESDESLTEFTTQFKQELTAKLKEVDGIKKDLQGFRDLAVSGSLFSSFEERMKQNDDSSRKYGYGSIVCLGISALVMGVLLCVSLLPKVGAINYLLPSSISFILLTASFVCSHKSAIYHKLAEEYAHKATLLRSFVGYRERFDDEEYGVFFKEVIEAIKVNASDKSDKYFRTKWFAEKAIDGASKAVDGLADAAKAIGKTTNP